MEQRFESLEKQLDLPTQPVQTHDRDTRHLRGIHGGKYPNDLCGACARGHSACGNPGNRFVRTPGFMAFCRLWGYWCQDIIFDSPYDGRPASGFRSCIRLESLSSSTGRRRGVHLLHRKRDSWTDTAGVLASSENASLDASQNIVRFFEPFLCVGSI